MFLFHSKVSIECHEGVNWELMGFAFLITGKMGLDFLDWGLRMKTLIRIVEHVNIGNFNIFFFGIGIFNYSVPGTGIINPLHHCVYVV